MSMDKNLTNEELGLLSTMLVLSQKGVVNLNELMKRSNDSYQDVIRVLNSLKSKEYIQFDNDKCYLHYINIIAPLAREAV